MCTAIGGRERRYLRRAIRKLEGLRQGERGLSSSAQIVKLLANQRLDEDWLLSRARLLLDQGWAERAPVVLDHRLRDVTLPGDNSEPQVDLGPLTARRIALEELARAFGAVVSVPVRDAAQTRVVQFFSSKTEPPAPDEFKVAVASSGVPMTETLERVVSSRGWVRLFLGSEEVNLWIEAHRRGHRWRGHKSQGGFTRQVVAARRAVRGTTVGAEVGGIDHRLLATATIVVVETRLGDSESHALFALAAVEDLLRSSDAVVFRDGELMR